MNFPLWSMLMTKYRYWVIFTKYVDADGNINRSENIPRSQFHAPVNKRNLVTLNFYRLFTYYSYLSYFVIV